MLSRLFISQLELYQSHDKFQSEAQTEVRHEILLHIPTDMANLVMMYVAVPLEYVFGPVWYENVGVILGSYVNLYISTLPNIKWTWKKIHINIDLSVGEHFRHGCNIFTVEGKILFWYGQITLDNNEDILSLFCNLLFPTPSKSPTLRLRPHDGNMPDEMVRAKQDKHTHYFLYQLDLDYYGVLLTTDEYHNIWDELKEIGRIVRMQPSYEL